jgi:hypothetical protein
MAWHSIRCHLAGWKPDPLFGDMPYTVSTNVFSTLLKITIPNIKIKNVAKLQ